MLLRRYLCERLAAYYAQPAHKVVGSIDSGFISRIPSGIKSADAAPVREAALSSPSSHDEAAAAASAATSRSQQRMKGGINFSSLWGEWHWKRTYRRVYQEQQGMWLTPVELFRPYYSNILANFAVQSLSGLSSRSEMNGGKFEIVEIGGGRGTNAEMLLNALRENHSDVYDKLQSYTIFDTSETLQELQREVLIGNVNKKTRSVDGGCQHADKINLVNVDMMDVAEGNAPFLSASTVPTVVISLELLDNLPHDKVGRCIETRDLLQAEVVPVALGECDCEEGEQKDGSLAVNHSAENHGKANPVRGYMERFAPMTDPLLSRILSVAPALYSPGISHGPIWIPTVALGVLMKLFEARPNSSVAFADFDWLPPPEVHSFSQSRERGIDLSLTATEPATGDPLVTDMDGNDHISYLASPPDALCDILFPTDFGRLAAFVKKMKAHEKSELEAGESLRKVSPRAMKQSEFLLKYGKSEVEKTKSFVTGYSPLIHDFGNCSVLVVT